MNAPIDESKLLEALPERDPDESGIDDEPQRQVNLMLRKRKDESADQALARAALTPEYMACNSIHDLNRIGPFKDADITLLAGVLEKQTKQLQDGHFIRAESILVSQANTLDALFHHMLRRSMLNMGEYYDAANDYMKLALRAQSQCAATLSKLADIKKPTEILRQTNIAHGHQQVNNFPEKEIPPNELLEEKDGERLEPGAAETPGKTDQTLETVEAKHRAEDD